MQLELFQDIPAYQDDKIPLEDIFEAYYQCRKHKRGRSGALQFEVDLEANLFTLWEEINNGTWEPRPSTVFVVQKPVTREIFAAAFRDRIVHHLIIGRLNALFEKYFIYDSYSCRTCKGTHFGIARTARFMRRSSQQTAAWVLKIDIRGYFMSINRNILYAKLAAFIDERYHTPDKKRIKELCRIIIFNDPVNNCIRHSPATCWDMLPKDKSLFTAKKDCGLPIGNLTSQIFANYYLTGFDHFIKQQCGVQNYGRYVDDCIIVHHSKAFLKKLILISKEYLKENLGLVLHSRKIYLQPCVNGVRFLGAFIKPSHIVIHHRTFQNFTKALEAYNVLAKDHKPDKEERGAFIASVNSYLGILRHYKTFKKRKLLLDRQLSLYWHKYITVGAGINKIMIKGKKR